MNHKKNRTENNNATLSQSKTAHTVRLPARVYASLPPDDPRFDALRAELEEAAARGRGSPIPRNVGEYALVGYLFTHGAFGAASGEAPDLAALGITDRAEIKRVQNEIAEAAAGFSFD